MDSYLQAENLNLTFAGGLQALRSVDLRLPMAEFVSIVGPSGCGKSTLLRLVAGLLQPTSGTLMVDGLDSQRARKEKTDIAFVFQSATLLPWRNVENNVRLPLELRGRLNADAEKCVQETIELVGLRDFRRSYPHELSGGMQMRASLARALATKPHLLLLDEPFGALDDITRQRLNEELLSLWERDRFTALFVTHNVSEAVFLSQRVLVMSARPGTIIREVKVPFDYPRQPELRAAPEFARLTGEVSALLRSGYTE